jgi:hypothetical protein
MAVDSVCSGKRGEVSGLINDDSEAFLAVGDDQQVVDQALMPLGKGHGDTTAEILKKREPTSRIAQRRLGETNNP